MELVEKVGLGDRYSHRPAELSGGEQQRVAVARALINQPAIVLGDEPTGELDTHTAAEIMALLRDLNQTRGQTFVIVTHDPSAAEKTDRTIYLSDGTILREERRK
jgi:putative ABC transport system ATP-binding protein